MAYTTQYVTPKVLLYPSTTSIYAYLPDQVTNSTSTYVEAKRFTITTLIIGNSKVTMEYDHRVNNNAGSSWAKVKVGDTWLTEYENSTDVWTTRTHSNVDLTGLQIGDTISLWQRENTGTHVSGVKEFKILATESTMWGEDNP